MWTPAQAIRFLRYARVHDPDFADLVELLICTGLSKGEALGLHWDDVHLNCPRSTTTGSTSPRPRPARAATGSPCHRASSRSWPAARTRVPADLARPHGGYVLHRDDGEPLHPEYVLNHFHHLARRAGVPRIHVHDLRHLAATLALTRGIELTIVSKTLSHSTVSTTANIYEHLSKPAARQAVNAIAAELDHAERRHDHQPTTQPGRHHRQAGTGQYGPAF